MLNIIIVLFLILFLYNISLIYGFSSSFASSRGNINKYKNNLIMLSSSSSNIKTQEVFLLKEGGLAIQMLTTNPSAAAAATNDDDDNSNSDSSIISKLNNILSNINKNSNNRRKNDKNKQPILFIHGSYHSAWCWAEEYFDYFSTMGHNCYAISLRGTSSTGLPPGDTSSTVKLKEHTSDVNFVLSKLIEIENYNYNNNNNNNNNKDSSVKPIIISHSFGGLITMKLLEDDTVYNKIGGLVFLCSVPPSGNGDMTNRFLKERFFAALRIVQGFVFKAATTNIEVCRDLFFDESVSDEDIRRYMRRFQADSRVGIDLRDVSSSLPSLKSDSNGKASFLNNDLYSINSLIIGAENDYIVDTTGVIETAKFFNQNPIFIKNLYHDIMLGPKAKYAADIIQEWITNLE